MDSMYNICHETTFEAIIDTGLDPKNLRGDRTGMYYGCCTSDVRMAQSQVDPTLYNYTWAEDFPEVSKTFGFKGPCTTHDSVCASSISALNEAIHAFKSNVVDTAIAAGVTISNAILVAYCFRQLGMTSDDGVSRCMDKDANGYVR